MADLLHRLTCRRTLDATPEVVFRAFLNAEILKQWWSPKGYTAIECYADPRVGGRYGLVMRSITGTDTVRVRGVYKEITPPTRLVFTHSFESESAGAVFATVGLIEHETLVTVQFIDCGSSTEVVLAQEQIPSPDAEEALRYGWNGILDGLAEHLRRR